MDPSIVSDVTLMLQTLQHKGCDFILRLRLLQDLNAQLGSWVAAQHKCTAVHWGQDLRKCMFVGPLVTK